MDIDLNIESLQDYNEQIKGTIEQMKSERDNFSSKVDSMNQAWDAPSYTSFRVEAYFIINGIFSQSIDDAIALRDTLSSVKEKAVELRKKSNSMIYVLAPEGSSIIGQDTSKLYYDSAQTSTIRSIAFSAQTALNAISRDYNLVSEDMRRLKTLSIAPFSDVIPNTNVLTDRLERLSTLMNDFDQGLFELESEMSGLTNSITGERFVGFEGFVTLLPEDNDINTELALMLFKTPAHLLSDHEKKLLDELKEAGYTLEGIIGSQGLSIFAGLDIAHDINQSQFSIMDAVYAALLGDQNKLLRRLGRGIPGIGIAFGACDAYLAYDEEYRNNPQLSERRRISDSQVESMVVMGETLAMEGIVLVLANGFGAVGGALGSVIPGVGNVVGAAVGTTFGTVTGIVASIAYTLNAEQIQSETIRWVGTDGTSWLDDNKTGWYELVWKQD